MSRVSQNILTTTGDDWNVTGDPYEVSGRHLITVAIYTSNLRGTVVIEGTLDVDLATADWFPIAPPKEFPSSTTAKKSEVAAFSVNANLTFVRARLVRLGDEPPIQQRGAYGLVDRVLLNA